MERSSEKSAFAQSSLKIGDTVIFYFKTSNEGNGYVFSELSRFSCCKALHDKNYFSRFCIVLHTILYVFNQLKGEGIATPDFLTLTVSFTDAFCSIDFLVIIFGYAM